MTRFKHLVLLLALYPLASAPAFAETNAAALALNEGRADDAIHLLEFQLASNPADAAAHQLLCRVYFAEESFNAAIQECASAVSAAPGDSNNELWLGRAYGMKASQANPVTAFALARKTVASFERSVALDPTNVAAMRDLGEYYVNAPAIVGGGLDKARALAHKMMSVSPAKAHRLLGQIAQKDGDFSNAEAEFKRAVEEQRTAASYVDLAQFYLARKQFDETLAPIQTASRIDKPRDSAAVDAASLLVASNRSPTLAEQLLRDYLASPAKTDAAPAFKVHVQLGDLLLKRSDRAGAELEYDAALALASGYAPAKRARSQLSQKTASQTAGANAIP